MSILFKKKRLHIGYRARDWSKVWLEQVPDPEGKSQGEQDIMLYNTVDDEAGERGPMEGEVKWLPLFDINNCESSKAAERHRLQKQFLSDAYKYLVENDRAKVRDLEDDFNQPGFSRWQEWFSEAKAWKKKQLKRKAYVRKKRINIPRQGDLSQADAEKAESSDTSDSAYESDDETESWQDASQMPPPRRPASRKRGPTYTVVDGKTAAKKQRQSTSRPSTSSTRASVPYMSGALASRSPSLAPSVPSRPPSILSNMNSGIGFDDFEDEIMDARDPLGSEAPPLAPRSAIANSSALRAAVGAQWGFAGINTPPATAQQRSGGGDNGTDRNERARQHEREHEGLGMNEEEAIQAAIRASVEPQSARETNDDVVDSIETGADEA